MGSATSAPHVGPPEMTPHERFRQRVDGPARDMALGHPVVDHDAAADPTATSKIDFLL